MWGSLYFKIFTTPIAYGLVLFSFDLNVLLIKIMKVGNFPAMKLSLNCGVLLIKIMKVGNFCEEEELTGWKIVF